MDLADAKPYFESATALLALLGMVWGLWLALRGRVATWWLPYRQAVLSMGLVPALVESVDGLKSDFALMTSTQTAKTDSDPTMAYFECNPEGMTILVNETYMRWTGCNESDLLGWNFLNVIHPDDREPFRNEWLSCLRDGRKYAKTVRLHKAGGGWFTGDVNAVPVPEHGRPVKWVGFVRRPETRLYDDDVSK